jgi:4-alpha-glucanotransferase
MGWLNTASEKEIEFATRYMHRNCDEGFNWAMIKTALMSVADTAIIMMPDLLGLGSAARINTPSTVGDNWKWRIKKECINSWLAGILKENTLIYGRINKIL